MNADRSEFANMVVQTQERASELLKEMIGEGMAVDLLHASKSKKQRDATVDAFKTGKVSVTVLVLQGPPLKQKLPTRLVSVKPLTRWELGSNATKFNTSRQKNISERTLMYIQEGKQRAIRCTEWEPWHACDRGEETSSEGLRQMAVLRTRRYGF